MPRCQIAITPQTITASTSGTQPPSAIFMPLDATNAKSITAKHPATSPASGRLQRQISRMAMNSSTVVSAIVSDTAMPYAAARLSDFRNPSANPMVTIISSQLTVPT